MCQYRNVHGYEYENLCLLCAQDVEEIADSIGKLSPGTSLNHTIIVMWHFKIYLHINIHMYMQYQMFLMKKVFIRTKDMEAIDCPRT